MKKYKLWEVIKMMGEDNSLIFTNGRNTIGLDDMNFLEVKKSVYDDVTLDENLRLNNIEWEIVQTPVTLMEVMKSNCKCMVKHELLAKMKGSETDNDVIKSTVESVRCGEFVVFTDILLTLSWMFNSSDVKKIMNDGEWYLED